MVGGVLCLFSRNLESMGISIKTFSKNGVKINGVFPEEFGNLPSGRYCGKKKKKGVLNASNSARAPVSPADPVAVTSHTRLT